MQSTRPMGGETCDSPGDSSHVRGRRRVESVLGNRMRCIERNLKLQVDRQESGTAGSRERQALLVADRRLYEAKGPFRRVPNALTS